MHWELYEYSTKLLDLEKKIILEININEYFDIKVNLPIVNQMSDAKIIQILLNPEQEQEINKR